MDDDAGKKETASTVPLEPNVPVRDFMVNTAVHFLQNAKVQSSPLSQKRAFLIKKGLTNEEIDRAIEKAAAATGVQNPVAIPSVNVASHHGYTPSFWTRINRYGSAVIVVGIVLYGLHQFYKLYIEPLLYGAKKRDNKLTQMEEQLLELSRSLSQLKRSISSIEETLVNQQEQMQKYLTEKHSGQCVNPSLFLELKSDILSVKSLLLNRHQFPNAPKFSPTIPSWQLGGGDSKNEEPIKNELESGKETEKDENSEAGTELEREDDGHVGDREESPAPTVPFWQMIGSDSSNEKLVEKESENSKGDGERDSPACAATGSDDVITSNVCETEDSSTIKLQSEDNDDTLNTSATENITK